MEVMRAPLVVKRFAVLIVVIAAGWLPLIVAGVVGAGSELHAAAGQQVTGVKMKPAQQPGPGAEVVTHTALYTAFLPVMYAPFDMLDFFLGDEELIFEVQFFDGEPDPRAQARHQTQISGTVLFHTKGNNERAEWEELWADDDFIYRGSDTSPGNGQYYTLRDPGMYGSKWAPRYWAVGETFYRLPHVTFYDKLSCAPLSGGRHGTYLRFEAFHRTYTFESGITLDYVIELAWLGRHDGPPLERYFYADSYGLVGWWSSSGFHSHISEIHAPGARPDNMREKIGCLDRSATVPPQFRGLRLRDWPGLTNG